MHAYTHTHTQHIQERAYIYKTELLFVVFCNSFSPIIAGYIQFGIVLSFVCFYFIKTLMQSARNKIGPHVLVGWNETNCNYM